MKAIYRLSAQPRETGFFENIENGYVEIASRSKRH